MRSARFVPAARREFLAEIVYYNQEQPGLGARFTDAVEESAAGATALMRRILSPAVGFQNELSFRQMPNLASGIACLWRRCLCF